MCKINKRQKRKIQVNNFLKSIILNKNYINFINRKIYCFIFIKIDISSHKLIIFLKFNIIFL